MPHILTIRSICALALLGVAAPAFAAKVDNPAYLAWTKYKPGTSVTTQTNAVMGGAPAGSPMANGMKTEITQTLKAVTADAATVTVQMKIDMAGAPSPPAHDITVPAKIDQSNENLPQSMDSSHDKYEVKDVKTGAEDITVNGKKIHTTTRQMTLVNDADHSVSHVEVWSSPDIPGSQVKMTADGDMGPSAHNMKMTSEVTTFKIVK